MLRRKYYPAAIKYLQQAIDKWDGDDQDLAQVFRVSCKLQHAQLRILNFLQLGCLLIC